MKWISRLYIIFVGILLAMTTGFGVAALYPEPIRPQYPVSRITPVPESCYKTPEAQTSKECAELISKDTEARTNEQIEYEKKNTEFELKNIGYTRTAVFLGIILGSIYAVCGLLLLQKAPLITNGFMFGAVLTAILTRLLISLASLGSEVGSSQEVGNLSYIEFVLLIIATRVS
jgi:hypothetical protein